MSWAKAESDSRASVVTGKTSGIKNRGTIITGGGHIVGGDFTINGATVEDLVKALDERGLLRQAEIVNMQRRQIILLAQRLKPREQLDFDQAISELAHLVDIAVDAVRHGLLHGKSDNDAASIVVAEAEDDAEFLKANPPCGQVRMTPTGMLLRLNHPATIRLCDLMNAHNQRGALTEAIGGMFPKSMPWKITTHLGSALLSLGPATLMKSDHASRGVAITSLWVGPSWARSL
jgi:hypothetical protein